MKKRTSESKLALTKPIIELIVELYIVFTDVNKTKNVIYFNNNKKDLEVGIET